MTTKAMPLQGTDLKEGVYRTDPMFMGVLKKDYPISFDLAASADNAQHRRFFTEADDALSMYWHEIGGWLWLNPPYDNIGQWAEKCAVEASMGAKILFLVPASVGSNWYRNYVEDFAKPIFLTGRLVFEFRYPIDYMDRKTIKINQARALEGLDPIPCARAGQMNTDPYPKDLMLAVYDRGLDIDQKRPETWLWNAYL
jgi:phage N-6-adenine-methyltransferase